MKKFLCLIFVLLAIHSCAPRTEDFESVEGTVEYFNLNYEDGGRFVKIITFDRDGHKWYCVAGSHNINHHPDCPCQKKQSETLFNW